MSTLSSLKFWLALAATVILLSGVGFLISYLVVPKPLRFQRTTYFEFAVPKDWVCDLQGKETVCKPPGNEPYDAIIILAAKYRNQDDTRDAYERHLLQPQVIKLRDGSDHASEVVRVRRASIGNYNWVDGLHFQSEVQNYYTRYLATVTSHISVLITYSYYHKVEPKRVRELEAVVESLRIFQRPSAFN